MAQQNEQLLTPRELETTGYKGVKLCQATQVEYRKKGKLGFYRVGNKIYYAVSHLQNLLTACEAPAANQN